MAGKFEVSILGVARSMLRLLPTTRVPARGQMPWVRVFGQCELVESGCWEYPRPRPNGYGYINIDGKHEGVHRVAWAHFNGAIPTGLNVLHKCDNPPCCNPGHLFVGTLADNNRDRQAKGRSVIPTNGPDFHRAKTHCPHGHPYSEDNIYRRKSGRSCRTCRRDQTRAANDRRRQERQQRLSATCGRNPGEAA